GPSRRTAPPRRRALPADAPPAPRCPLRPAGGVRARPALPARSWHEEADGRAALDGEIAAGKPLAIEDESLADREEDLIGVAAREPVALEVRGARAPQDARQRAQQVTRRRLDREELEAVARRAERAQAHRHVAQRRAEDQVDVLADDIDILVRDAHGVA